MLLKKNEFNFMTIEHLNQFANQEASWLQYFGSDTERRLDNYNDVNFYDRIINTECVQRTTRHIPLPLPMRCAACFITSKKPVLESKVEDLESTSNYRNHDNNIYTPLEYVLANKIDGYEKLIETLRS